MYKPSAKKLLFIGGALLLLLAAFLTGSIAMSSAQAASSGSQGKGGNKPGSSNQTKAIVTIIGVSGDKIQATVLEPSQGQAVTIITTANTAYEPDRNIVASGKTLAVLGTLNSDGTITAEHLVTYDPTVAEYGGAITSINGSTLTVQAKDGTHTILLTDSTTFLKGLPASKTTQPASRGDLKVGVTIEANGKLNSDGSLTAMAVIILPSGTTGSK
jgi:hypothetical protein